MITVVIIGMIILILLVGLFIYMAYFVSHPHCHSLETMKQRVAKTGCIQDYEAMEKEILQIPSHDGYLLHAELLSAKEESKRYVIINHGYTANRCVSLRYVQLFHKLGFHCLIYDNRRHGENAPAICTLGLEESKDLLFLIDWTKKRFGSDIILGLHGESMGSALQLIALKERPEVAFVVNDCGFADLISVLKHKVTRVFHFPEFTCYPASLANRILFGYSFLKVRPIDSLKDNRVPICFIHGEADSFIPMEHSIRMKEATAGYSELHLFPGAEHADSYATDQESYKNIVERFLKTIKVMA